MMRRLVTLISAVALVVVATFGTAHGAGLAAKDAQSLHAAHSMIAQSDSHAGCDPATSRDRAKADGCAAACAALTGCLCATGDMPAATHPRPVHRHPEATVAQGQDPALRERPPRRRLL